MHLTEPKRFLWLKARLGYHKELHFKTKMVHWAYWSTTRHNVVLPRLAPGAFSTCLASKVLFLEEVKSTQECKSCSNSNLVRLNLFALESASRHIHVMWFFFACKCASAKLEATRKRNRWILKCDVKFKLPRVCSKQSWAQADKCANAFILLLKHGWPDAEPFASPEVIEDQQAHGYGSKKCTQNSLLAKGKQTNPVVLGGLLFDR